VEAPGRGEDVVGGRAGRVRLAGPGRGVRIAQLGMDGEERAERELEGIVEGGEEGELGVAVQLRGGRPAGTAHARSRFGLRAWRAASASRRRKLWPSIRQMSAWWVRRSISAVTQLALGKTLGQSLKARLVVMTIDFCS